MNAYNKKVSNNKPTTKQIKRIISFFVVAIMACFGSLQAQTFKAFSGSEDTYIQELSEFVHSDKNMKKPQLKEYEDLLLQYQSVWEATSSSQRKDVITLSNLMLKKRIRPQPGFYDFISSQIAFASSNQSRESFNQWYKGLLWVINSSTLGGFNNAVSTSYSLVKENVLYSTPSVKWSVTHNGYNIRIDTARGPYIDFKTPIELTYASQNDANTIHSTIGKYYIVEQRFEGNGGKVDWTRAGLAADNVFVSLKKYSVSLTRAAIFADSVTFTNKEYFQHQLQGTFEDKCADRVAGATYPRFYSYKKEEIIKNIFPDVNYVGGFTQQGGKFLGTGQAQEPAKLVIYKEGKVFCVAKAIVHPFSQEGIATPDCQVTFYVNNDSIYHPGLMFRYNKASKEIACIDNKEGISASPWIDSYHAIDIYTEAVYTKLPEHTITFGAVKGPQNTVSFAAFESNNYYTQAKWDKIGGIDETNPLYKVSGFAKKYNKKEIPVKEFANYIGLDATQAEVMLMRLANNGFISYESYRKTAIVKEKLYDYIKASTKKKDYDNIRFVSSTKGGKSAELNIFDMDLRMYGIENFSLSDTHFVNIAPLNGEMVMRKNRNFELSGKITAGRFIMGGEHFTFDYDKFLLKLPKVDSLAFYVPLYEDSTKIVKIQTPLQNLDCELVIDSSNNKSSIKKLDGYPMLTSLKDSYVYYDQPRIQGGAYPRDSFYFKLNPFRLKNLLTFRTDSVYFTGVLRSAGIFPDINEPLRVMRDYSLGFKTQTPQSGLAAYGGKGKYYNSIDLSLQGLLGTGKLVYVASESESKMFVFLPKEMNCTTDKFLCKAQGAPVEFPDAAVSVSKENWHPYEDYMSVTQTQESFMMYKGESLHTGTLVVRPAGLFGMGANTCGQMIVSSQQFAFKSTAYSADTSSFTLNSLDGTNVAFQAQGVKGKVDFVKRSGEFTSYEGVKKMDLTYLQYTCDVDRFDWGMDTKELALLNSQSVSGADFAQKSLKELVALPQPGVVLTCTNPTAKQLSFSSVHPTLSLKDNKLSAKEVFVIKSADCAIEPVSNTVVIRPGAQMDTIEDAYMLASVENKLHSFYKSRVAIYSSELFSANGYVDYIDENGMKHSLFMSNIAPLAGITKAQGAVSKEEPLALSSAFQFYGNVSFASADTNYTFDGGVNLNNSCTESGAWLKFNSVIDPKKIYIPVSQAPQNMDAQRLTASVLFTGKNMQPKSAFLSFDREADNAILSASGFLSFNKSSNAYEILPTKESTTKEAMQYLTINKQNCATVGKGNINIGIANSSLVWATDYGSVKVSNDKGTGEMSMSLGLTFPFNPQALDAMGVELYEDLNLSPIAFETSDYKQQLISLCGEAEGEDYFADLIQSGEWKDIPKQMAAFTLYFSNIKLQWDDVLGSYVSYGDAELSLVGKHQVNKKIKTRVQLTKNGVATEIKLYIEANPDKWYYFNYNGVAMSVLSSDGVFNDFITNAKDKEKEFKDKKYDKVYTYRLASESDKRTFLRKLEKIDQ